MKPHLFVLSALIGLWTLAACSTVATPEPLTEITVPTVETAVLVAATKSATSIIVEATAPVPSAETATHIPRVMETITPLPPPPTTIRPPYSYPEPNATPEPTYTPRPTVTPHYTTDGQWRIISNYAMRFEVPAHWLPGPRRITNYPQQTPDAPPVTYAPREEPYITLEYNEIGYHKYTANSYIQQGYEPISVAGYPALFHSEYSEPFRASHFGLIVEGPEMVYTFFLHYSMPPEAGEHQVQAALTQGEGLLQHIADTFELFPLPGSTIPIENQTTITGTVTGVDRLGGFEFTLEPSLSHPFTEARIWYGTGTRTSLATPDGEELVFGNLKVGNSVEIRGRPLSAHEFLSDTIIVTQTGIQGAYTEAVRYEGEVFEIRSEVFEVVAVSRAYPNAFIVAQISEDSATVLQDSTGASITYADILPGAKVTIIGYARPDALNVVLAEQVIISP